MGLVCFIEDPANFHQVSTPLSCKTSYSTPSRLQADFQTDASSVSHHTHTNSSFSFQNHLSQNYREHTSLCPSKISKPSVSIFAPPFISCIIGVALYESLFYSLKPQVVRFLLVSVTLVLPFGNLVRVKLLTFCRPLRRSRRRHWGNQAVSKLHPYQDSAYVQYSEAWLPLSTNWTTC